MLDMKRRSFIALVGAAAAWPLAARAQQGMPVIGFLNSASPEPYAPMVAAFQDGLKDGGYIVGQNVAIEYRWANAQYDRVLAMAAELVDRRVAVIVANTPGVQAVKAVITMTPIVFTTGSDPMQLGLVASLSRPGGNVTGLSLQAAHLAGKRLELLREVVPQLRRLAIIFNAGNAQPVLEMRETEAAARTLGIEVVPLEIRRVADFSPAFQAFRGNADALYVAIDQLMVANLMRILTLALGARLPTIFSTRDFIRGGGFMSYGPSYTERFARAADYVDKILRGAKPGEIPVEQPTKFELVVNLITAQALGLEVPPTLLARADDVIE